MTPQTETEHLIRQAIRELEIADHQVRPSLDQPGFYEITKTDRVALIPMDADYKGIVAALKARTHNSDDL